MTVHTQQLKKYISDSRPRFEDLLGQLVEVPSISMDPARAGEMPRAATLAVQYLKSLGADAQIVETGGYPIISGGWMTGAGYPTVTIYNHLDVQPAQEPESRRKAVWRIHPFRRRADRRPSGGRTPAFLRESSNGITIAVLGDGAKPMQVIRFAAVSMSTERRLLPRTKSRM